jgi:hypothetical protein
MTLATTRHHVVHQLGDVGKGNRRSRESAPAPRALSCANVHAHLTTFMTWVALPDITALTDWLVQLKGGAFGSDQRLC